MKYILDTHYILWSLFEPEKITKSISNILLDENKIKFVSSISLWEISLKYGLGKLKIENKTPDDIYESIKEAGFELLQVDNNLYSSYYRLPHKKDHRDQFDRMLIWQAINHDLVLVTANRKIKQYEIDGLKTKIP